MSFVLTLMRLSEVTKITESGSLSLGGGLVELSFGIGTGVVDLEVGVSGRLMVMLEGGWIGEMSSDWGEGRLLLLVEVFWELTCLLDDFLDIDLVSRKILDLLVKYLSRLVCRECLLMDLGSKRTTLW